MGAAGMAGVAILASVRAPADSSWRHEAVEHAGCARRSAGGPLGSEM
jgi:hypothetical protein